MKYQLILCINIHILLERKALFIFKFFFISLYVIQITEVTSSTSEPVGNVASYYHSDGGMELSEVYSLL